MKTGPDMVAASDREGSASSDLPPLALLNLQSRILDLIDTAIIAVDLAGLIIFVNPYASFLYGWAGDELLGTMASELSPLAINGDVEAEIGRAIVSGSSWEGTFDVRRKDGTVVSVHAVDSPLYDGHGELVGIVSAGMDATRQRAAEALAGERTQAAQVSQFLADLGAVLTMSMDYEATLEALGRSSVPFLGDLCLIDVADGDVVRRVVAAHHIPEQQDLVDELELRYPPDPHGDHPAVQALRTGTPALAAEMTDEFLRATTRDEIHYGIVKELNFQSYICVPLIARGHNLGALTLVSCDPDRRFDEGDLEVAKEVAWRASLILDNARLLSQSSYVAQVLQSSLMPPSLPAIPGVEVAARYVAFGAGMEVGGDFYDVFSAGRGAWVFALGDVCGRGPEAAVVTGSIRHTLRSAALEVRQPGRLLAVANEVLLHDSSDVHLFATLLCGILRPQASGARISLANAGHPPPIVVRADGTVETPRNGDVIIGVFDNATWSTRALTLHPGDLLIAYTDGITEARREGDFFGEERLAQVAHEARRRSVEEIADRIIDAVRAFAGHEPSDDLALVVLRVLEE
ncbi:MAG TPA: SpoIIE family protein phosphatase [Acidimicrobiales bacterium]|jgi:PAS domain S-box-containing protein